MTERVHSLIVVLKEDMRVDDVQAVMFAIGMIGPVLSVAPVAADHHSWMAEQRADRKWRRKIYAMMKEED